MIKVGLADANGQIKTIFTAQQKYSTNKISDHCLLKNTLKSQKKNWDIFQPYTVATAACAAFILPQQVQVYHCHHMTLVVCTVEYSVNDSIYRRLHRVT